MVALKDVMCLWQDLGEQLGLSYFALKEIEQDNRGIGRKCMREMLAAWLQGHGGEYSKQALKTALNKIDCAFC